MMDNTWQDACLRQRQFRTHFLTRQTRLWRIIHLDGNCNGHRMPEIRVYYLSALGNKRDLGKTPGPWENQVCKLRLFIPPMNAVWQAYS